MIRISIIPEVDSPPGELSSILGRPFLLHERTESMFKHIACRLGIDFRKLDKMDLVEAWDILDDIAFALWRYGEGFEVLFGKEGVLGGLDFVRRIRCWMRTHESGRLKVDEVTHGDA